MTKKTFTPEQIVAKLRQIEVLLSQSKTVPLACKEGGLMASKNAVLGRQIFVLEEQLLVFRLPEKFAPAEALPTRQHAGASPRDSCRSDRDHSVRRFTLTRVLIECPRAGWESRVMSWRRTLRCRCSQGAV